MMTGYFLVFLGYLAFLTVIGLVFSRRVGGFEDYFLASRRLSAPLMYYTVCASWVGASSVLVTTDQAFRSGVRAFWLIGLPAVLTTLIFGLFLVRRIHGLPAQSLTDLAEVRYGRAFRHAASAFIVWYMALLAASQMVALGSFLRIFLGRPYFFCLAAGAAVVLLYSTLGGFFTVTVTDRLHFFVLMGGLFLLFFWLLGSTPLADLPDLAARLGRPGFGNFFSGWRENALVVLSFVPAWLISPIIWQRIQSTRSAPSARRALLAAAANFLAVYALIVSIGMLFLPVFGRTRIDHPLLAEAVRGRSGGVLGGMIFVAVMAAILSTMDTAVNTGAFTLSRDIIRRFLPESTGRRQVLVGRGATLFVGGLAFLVATRFESILQTLGLASEIMAEGLFIPGMAMLFLQKRLPLAGVLSLAAGGGYSLLSFLAAAGFLPLRLPPWPYSVPRGLGLGLAGFALGWLMEALKSRSSRRHRAAAVP